MMPEPRNATTAHRQCEPTISRVESKEECRFGSKDRSESERNVHASQCSMITAVTCTDSDDAKSVRKISVVACSYCRGFFEVPQLVEHVPRCKAVSPGLEWMSSQYSYCEEQCLYYLKMFAVSVLVEHACDCASRQEVRYFIPAFSVTCTGNLHLKFDILCNLDYYKNVSRVDLFDVKLRLGVLRSHSRKKTVLNLYTLRIFKAAAVPNCHY